MKNGPEGFGTYQCYDGSRTKGRITKGRMTKGRITKVRTIKR